MLRESEAVFGYHLGAVDGQIGTVEDLYFDDRFWVIRYLVVNTGSWLEGRSVLVSPYSVKALDHESETILTDLTKAQIENSPSASEAVPVSRQFETAVNEYYGWPLYWYGAGPWGAYTIPPTPLVSGALEKTKESWDSNLRSTAEVTGYRVEATDGDIGHVAGFLIDDESWTIRYLIVDTRNWWPGKHVLVSWEWAAAIDWGERMVSVGLTHEAIKAAPEYDRETTVTRGYEGALCRHYGREGYWTEEGCPED